MDTALSIGAALVRERRASGMSQRELAEQLGTSQQQIARWEATEYQGASLARVEAVAGALGVAFGMPIAAEERVAYGSAAVQPVRDLGEIAARLREHYVELRDDYGIERIGIFGSFACGEQADGSDVDVLVHLREGAHLPWLGAGAAAFIGDILGREVDLFEPDSVRERIRSHVLREAIYVWEA